MNNAMARARLVHWVLFLVVSTGGRLAGATDRAGVTDRPPVNVLILMTDEQHYRSLSATGNPYIQTPHMDRLVREGALFTNATCVTPYCSPSRASLVTGIYPFRHQVLTNVSPHRNRQAPLDADRWPTLERRFVDAGYVARHRGKWHLGDKGDYPGYESWGYASRHPRDYRQLLDRQLPADRFDDPGPGRYLNRPVIMTPRVRQAYDAFHALPNNRLAYIATIGRSVIPPNLLPETQITNQVLELLEDNRDRPFVITASWSPPHDLWVVPDPYYRLVDRQAIKVGPRAVEAWDESGASWRLGQLVGEDGLREYAAIYHGMVKYIDDQIGRVLDKLDALNLADRTLVVFLTDHGDMVGAHGCVGKSIFSFYDDLVHIPLILRLPGRIAPGTRIDAPVSQIDLLPTLLEYASLAPVPQIHGQSLRPLIQRPDAPWRTYAYCQRANNGRMLRTREFKLVERLKPPAVACYDLVGDRAELHNMANQPAHAATLWQLHRRLIRTMRELGDPLAEKYDREVGAVLPLP